MNDPILNIIAITFCATFIVLMAIRLIRIVRIYIKASKEASLSFERKERVALFNKDFDRLNISIIYQGKSVKTRLVLFKGIIRNSGKSNIDRTKSHRPLQIKTNNNYRLRAVSITKKPTKSEVSLKIIDKKIIEFDLDCLKAGEQIEFEAIITIPNYIYTGNRSDDFRKSIRFDALIME